jgi:ketosteroid isomerase-like protein
VTAGPDVEAVEAVLEEFYAAFERLDMDRMAACWSHDDDVRCIHPGADLIEGWPKVSRSWAAVFVSSPGMQFFLTDTSIHVDGDQAVVTCTENVLSGEELASGKVLATKVLRRSGPGQPWRLVLHHASPVLR